MLVFAYGVHLITSAVKAVAAVQGVQFPQEALWPSIY